MKKFKFRLEKIKRYKEQLEQGKKMKLAAEQTRLQIGKNELSEAITMKDRYFSMYGVRKPGILNITTLIIAKRYLDKLAHDILNHRNKVAGIEKNVHKAQQDLLEAAKERKKYEKIKNRHLAAYKEEMTREENRELDEFGARANKIESVSKQPV
ncbi:MAG: flagellar export protein FliJ [candidate division Zixibacteria bacterium]|nr:flagellar export protein FliJ [candidate division Zixibacteria bacterium]